MSIQSTCPTYRPPWWGHAFPAGLGGALVEWTEPLPFPVGVHHPWMVDRWGDFGFLEVKMPLDSQNRPGGGVGSTPGRRELTGRPPGAINPRGSNSQENPKASSPSAKKQISTACKGGTPCPPLSSKRCLRHVARMWRILKIKHNHKISKNSTNKHNQKMSSKNRKSL